MVLIIRGKANKFKGEIRVPGDKSISHRSIMISSIAEGKSDIYGILKSEDVKRTIEAFKSMGVSILEYGDRILIEGVGLLWKLWNHHQAVGRHIGRARFLIHFNRG